MYQNFADRSLTGEVRLSYANLIEPKASKNGGDPKYSTALLIPKTDLSTVQDIQSAITAAYEIGVTKLWKGARPPLQHPLLKDGDGVKQTGEPYGDECHGCFVLNASCKQKPPVVHQSNIRTELAPSDIYSGMFARVTVEFYPFDSNGNRGVGCGLRAVLKTKDGEAFGSAVSAENDFAGLQQAAPAVLQYGTAPQPAAYPQYSAPAQPMGAINPITGLPM